MRTNAFLAVLAALALGDGAVHRRSAAEPRHDAPPSATGDAVVTLCDGETSAEIPGVKEGERPTRAQAQAVVGELMAAWRQKHPEARWDVAQAVPPAEEKERPGEIVPPRVPPPAAGESAREAPGGPQGAARGAEGAAESERRAPTPGEAAAGGATPGGAGGLPSAPQGAVQTGDTHGAFSERDERIWAVATENFVKEGHRIFHDADALGSANAVSCDMCHPDGSNTHPETYPKFQVQLGRVALLRDMINWCIQNPTRGKPLAEDDARLKALEAYILAQRKGVPLEFGKH